MKLSKFFKCSCIDGFTGDFCEFKIKQDHMLLIGVRYWSNQYYSEEESLLFNASGRLMGKINNIIEEIYPSCATILNGEAVLFSQISRGYSYVSQVNSEKFKK